ncbi:Microbial serine proteinase precursor [compost metagenome]
MVVSALFTNCAPPAFESIDLASMSGNDPLLGYSWHLNNSGQQVFAARSAVSGNDLNLHKTWGMGYYGNGIKVLVSDDGLEDTHEDLQGNFLYGSLSKDYTLSAPYVANGAAPKTANDNHGTAVAGLIAAAGGNGLGSRGVAPRAHIAIANFLSENVTQTLSKMVDQASGSFDVFNMSWGGYQNTVSAPDTGFESQLRYGVTSGRSGKGSVYVKAAGNDFFSYCNGSSTAVCVGNSNFDPDNTNPYVLVTGAMNSLGNAASYSSGGSNLWVSAFGGEYGDDSPAMVTTDRTGCSHGYAASNADLSFDRGSGNSNCNYSVTFNGTSSAAPVLSGVVALLLEANPQLTWRDVKYILAKTSKKVHPTMINVNHPRGVTSPSGYVWDNGWVSNGAGFPFHNWFGFGQVDVDAAVAMARSYSSSFGTFTDTGWANNLSGLSHAVPDNVAGGVTSSMAVASNLKIEAVQLRIWVTHPNISELALELTSPSGTKSVVVNMNNALTGIANYQGEIFLSNAFFQERAAGTWTLRVVDGKSGNTGTLTRWSLNFFGSN